MSIHRKYVSYYSHSALFTVTKFGNMSIQGNENSFFNCYFKSCPRSIFLKFEICPRSVHFTLLRKVRLMFWRQKESMKGKCYVFGGYKERNNACLVYLKCKLQRDRYEWWVFKSKCQKTVGRRYLEKRKQETRCRWCF